MSKCFLETADVFGSGEFCDRPPWKLYLVVGGVPLTPEFYDIEEAERVKTLVRQICAIANLYFRADRTDRTCPANPAVLSKLDGICDVLLNAAAKIHDTSAELAAPMNADNALEKESED